MSGIISEIKVERIDFGCMSVNAIRGREMDLFIEICGEASRNLQVGAVAQSLQVSK